MRGKLTPYAHKYTKASVENMHTSVDAHEIHPTKPHTQTVHVHGHGYSYMLTSAHIYMYNPSPYLSTCSGTHSEAHITMNMGKCTTMRVHASTYVQPSTCKCSQPQAHRSMHTNAYLSMCTLSFQIPNSKEKHKLQHMCLPVFRKEEALERQLCKIR